MRFLNVILLTVSGALIYASVLLPKISIKNSTISRSLAAVFSGTGVGSGIGLFIYLGVSNGDFLGSIFTGVIAAFTAGLVFYFYNK